MAWIIFAPGSLRCGGDLGLGFRLVGAPRSERVEILFILRRVEYRERSDGVVKRLGLAHVAPKRRRVRGAGVRARERPAAKDRILGKSLRLEEILIPKGSPYAGHALRDAPIRRETNLLVIAVRQPTREFVYNPEPDFVLAEGMTLVVMGASDGVKKLRALVATS